MTQGTAGSRPKTAKLGGLAVGWLTLFVVGTDLFVVSPILPLIARDWGLSAGAAGLGVGVFAASYMASAPLLGHVADRLGRRPVLLCCLVAFALANILTGMATGLAGLLAARAFAGVTAAGVTPSIYALVGEAAPPERRASRLALMVSGLLISLSIGTPIGALAAATIGWKPVFAALAAASLALVWANHQVWPATPPRGAAAGPAALGAAILGRRLLPTVVWSTALYGMYTYLGAGLTAAGYDADAIARTILCYGLGAILGTFAGGRAADRFGPRATMAASLVGLGLGLVALRLALPFPVLVVLAATMASAAAQLFFPAQQAGLAGDFPARRATVLAWNNSALFLGISLGSVIGGEAVRIGGFGLDLAVCAAIAFAGWAIAAVPRREPAAVTAA